MSDTGPTSRILLGRIVGAHGIRGEVVIHSFAAVAEDIGAYGPLSDKTGATSFKLSGVRAASKGVVARIAGVADRNAAEALKGTELYIARDKLPAPDDGEFYVADLIGMTVVDDKGNVIGKIVDAPDFGAGSLLEIRKTGVAQTELIPFTDAFVPHVDIAARRVTINPIVYAEDDADEPERGE
jgi:16S rRNA processing protein RimM